MQPESPRRQNSNCVGTLKRIPPPPPQPPPPSPPFEAPVTLPKVPPLAPPSSEPLASQPPECPPPALRQQSLEILAKALVAATQVTNGKDVPLPPPPTGTASQAGINLEASPLLLGRANFGTGRKADTPAQRPGESESTLPRQSRQAPASSPKAPASSSVSNRPSMATAEVVRPPEKSAAELLDAIVNRKRGEYLDTLRKVAPVINDLERDLREMFQRRRQSHRESGRKSGATIDVRRFIREKASGKHPIETRAFEAKSRARRKDHAVLLLVDVSGSMQENDKILNAFASALAVTEALERLQVRHAVFGFNEKLHCYKPFEAKSHPEDLLAMKKDACSNEAYFNNDGWALAEASKVLLRQAEHQRLLIVLSDGLPEPSDEYAGPEFELLTVSKALQQSRRLTLLALGVGEGTEHVKDYYSRSRANIRVEGLAKEMSEALREALEAQN